MLKWMKSPLSPSFPMRVVADIQNKTFCQGEKAAGRSARPRKGRICVAHQPQTTHPSSLWSQTFHKENLVNIFSAHPPIFLVGISPRGWAGGKTANMTYPNTKGEPGTGMGFLLRFTDLNELPYCCTLQP